MKKRFIAAAVPVLVAGSLAAAAPGMSQAAQERPAVAPKPSATAKAAAFQSCTAGKITKVMAGGSANYAGGSGVRTVPGSTLQFRGPKRGSDWVFVTVTAPATYVSDSGDYGLVRVELDGNPLKPGSLSAEYVYYANNSGGSFAGQYCAKVKGGGFHEIRLVTENVDDGDSSGATYLYNPLLRVEVAN